MAKRRATNNEKAVLRFEAVKIEPLFEVLDAVAWLDSPGIKDISRYRFPICCGSPSTVAWRDTKM